MTWISWALSWLGREFNSIRRVCWTNRILFVCLFVCAFQRIKERSRLFSFRLRRSKQLDAIKIQSENGAHTPNKCIQLYSYLKYFLFLLMNERKSMSYQFDFEQSDYAECVCHRERQPVAIFSPCFSLSANVNAYIHFKPMFERRKATRLCMEPVERPYAIYIHISNGFHNIQNIRSLYSRLIYFGHSSSLALGKAVAVWRFERKGWHMEICPPPLA